MVRKRILFHASFTAGVVLFLLCFVEGLLRFGVIIPSFKQYTRNLGYEIILDRKILFRIKPHSGNDINNFGYRDRDFSLAKTGKKRILFYGDSFVMGINVRSDQTLPKDLERLMEERYEVYNMGINSYGPDQSLIQFRNEGHKFHPDTVILCIYPSNDYNDISLNKLYKLAPDGDLRFNDNNPVAAAMTPFDSLYLIKYLSAKYNPEKASLESLFSTLFGESYDFDLINDSNSSTSKTKIASMRAILKEFKAALQISKTDFLVVIVPSWASIQENEFLKQRGINRDTYFINEDSVKSICIAESIDCINLYPLFLSSRDANLYDLNDRHLSVHGYNLTAGIIYEHLTERQKSMGMQGK